MTYAVIMAGGVGSRFWPASRKAHPKQFLNVFGDATLIQNTVARLAGVVEPENVFVVTNSRYIEQTRNQLPQVPEENILSEPISRNTAPCIAFAAAHLHRIEPGATMIVLPADHVIKNVKQFQSVLRTAIAAAQEPGSLVTIGIQPTHPATGYGYIQHDGSDSSEPDTAYRVKTFAEKPDLSTAERFLDSGDFLWNSGMFIWKVDSINSNLANHLPKVFNVFDGIDTSSASEVARAFEQSPSISIDYGVMERASHVYVVPGSFGWSDVGDWRAVYDESEKDEHGNATKGIVLLKDSSRCLVQAGGKLFALVGMHDTVVVESDDAVLICNRDSAQTVKNVVDYLNAHQLEEYV
ncbi:MAG: NTP transferase domain-containing protein [Rhodothermales bacterium]|nr:NTP transferase domain-containing protein [Rhodothermales bacterium]